MSKITFPASLQHCTFGRFNGGTGATYLEIVSRAVYSYAVIRHMVATQMFRMTALTPLTPRQSQDFCAYLDCVLEMTTRYANCSVELSINTLFPPLEYFCDRLRQAFPSQTIQLHISDSIIVLTQITTNSYQPMMRCHRFHINH